jgi:hypothetical protein
MSAALSSNRRHPAEASPRFAAGILSLTELKVTIKKQHKPNIDTTDTDGLNRYLSASEGLTAALQRNIEKVIEPALRERLSAALDRLQKNGRCRLPQRAKKRH